jgi:hypothetical protein
MKKIIMMIVIAMMGMLVLGCTTSFTRLPKPDEFRKPLAELKQEYPDLIKYDNWRVRFYYLPAEQLIDVWGNPTFTGLQLQKNAIMRGYLFAPVTVLIFHPSKYWFWEFENKCVEVLIDRPLYRGYKPCVQRLSVRDGLCFDRKD